MRGARSLASEAGLLLEHEAYVTDSVTVYAHRIAEVRGHLNL